MVRKYSIKCGIEFFSRFPEKKIIYDGRTREAICIALALPESSNPNEHNSNIGISLFSL